MNQPDPQQEPTMEEILASIRRIISEEGEEGAGESAETAAQPAAEEETPEPPADADSGGEDVLELTEVVEEKASDEDSEGDEGVLAAEIEPEPVAEPEPEADSDEVVFKVEDEEAAPEPELEPEPEPEPEAAPEPEPEPAPMFRAKMDMGLVSEPVAQAAASSFAGLGGAIQAARGLGMGDGHRTLEDIVKELLRPMLKTWLDQNLAGIVQRIVEREVVKLAGQADDPPKDLTDHS